MGEVNFYLKKPDTKNGKSLIYLQYKYNGKRLVYAFGQNINPKDWNKNKQRVKNNNQTTADGKHKLNDLLNNLVKVCQDAYNTEIANGIPEPDTIKAHLQAFINQNNGTGEDKSDKTLYNLINRFINNEIQYKGKDKSPNTIKTYKTTVGHLKEYEQKHKYSIDFDSITLNFYYSYTTFLKNKGLSQNAIAKNIQILKVFMSEGVDLNLTSNLQFKHKKFAVHREDTDAVFLNESEILNLYQYDFSNNKRLEQVRDLFVFGCCVGLRFSDYSDVKPENITTIDGEYFIKLKTKKTGELVIIPCNPVVLQIFEKYSHNPNKLPKSLSNQKFNDYIKQAAKEAGLAEIGRLATDPSKELWECISSHTCRRSFATNYYLQGFPTIDLMKITGHRTEKAFLTYIRISKLDTAKRLSTHMKKNWSNYLFKAAS